MTVILNQSNVSSFCVTWIPLFSTKIKIFFKFVGFFIFRDMDTVILDQGNGTMAAKWLNSVAVDFGVQFPKLSMRAIREIRSLELRLRQPEGPELEGKEVNVVIRDSNIQEKFVRIAGIPQNLALGVVKTRLKEFGTIIDARWERYRVAEDDVLYPVLATWMIVRMTLTKNIPSYITIVSYRAMMTETVPEKPVALPIDVDPMVSKALLDFGLQSSLSGGTPNLEISPTEQPVKSTDDPPRQTPPAQMIIPETQPDDSEPMTISMDPMEPNLGEVEPMETEKPVTT
ncbi:hypothetical protein OUZ56_024654 [Daphnia magna]|uniref:Uncharacterized protein n=1 Tax=Daphnia magna TaxID=35525 RepID=A0ABR0B160_9CRUS|nr:hypothetical protein OUZ56_024654 [Daphnia magna]